MNDTEGALDAPLCIRHIAPSTQFTRWRQTVRKWIASTVVALLGVAAFYFSSFGFLGQEVTVKGQAPQVEPPKAAENTQPFTGVWMPQSSVFNGKEQLPDKASRDMIRLSIENGEYKLFYITDPDPDKMMGRRLATADLAVDEKAGTFELTIKDGGKKGDRRHGIFELTETGLKMCYGPADKPRPTKFEAPAGSDNFCDTWERRKK